MPDIDAPPAARRASPPREVDDARVVLALERTLLAWTRTALALVGFGFVAARLALFMRELNPQFAPAGSQWIGLGVVAMGGVVQAAGLVLHAGRLRTLRAGQALPANLLSPAPILAGLFIVVALLLSVYLGTL